MKSESTPSPDTPTHLGKYVIQAVLGRGGMGVVYKAHDPGMNRFVAIKTVTDGFTSDSSMLKRFYREAEKTGRLTHPNIIIIYELGEENGHPYIVMEFVEGRTLESILKDAEQLPMLNKLRIIEQVCVALGYAHTNGVIHRDVKPANVIVRPDGVAKLLDFGIAVQEKKADMTLTKTGSIIGTVPYMAPERLYGSDIDGRSDIFAAGVMLYQLLTGSLPFTGEDMTLIHKLLHDPHPPLSAFLHEYPKSLDGIIDRALQKIPAERYGLAEEMAGDLYSVIEVVKKQHIENLLDRAKQLLDADAPMVAREVCLEILKLDNQQQEARRMLSALQHRISQKQHQEHAVLKRQQAEKALLEHNYEAAFSLLSEAHRLVPDDSVISEELEAVRQKKRVGEQITVYLQQAGDAKRNGNLSAARAIVQQALDLDGANSRVRLAFNSLVREAEVAEKQAEAKKLLYSARESIAAKKFDTAIEQIRQAELLDPSSVEVPALLSRASEGLHHEQRRGLLDQIEKQIASANSEQETKSALEKVEAALETLPNDPVLVRHKMHLDQQLRVLGSRRHIEETISQSRLLLETSPPRALERVREALTLFPSEEGLLVLAKTIEDRISKHSQEEMRNGYLAQARTALAEQDFGLAVDILERCQGDCFSVEVADLLESTRKTASQQRNSKAVSDCYPRVRRLLDEGKYKEAIADLDQVLRLEPDKSLQRLLHEAQAGFERESTDDKAALQEITSLAGRGYFEQALEAISSSLRIANLPETLAVKATAEQALRIECTDLLRAGRAYASLTSETPLLDWTDHGPSTPESRSQTSVWGMLEARRHGIADDALSQSATRLNALPIRDTFQVKHIVARAKLYSPFASPDAKEVWKNSILQRLKRICVRSPFSA